MLRRSFAAVLAAGLAVAATPALAQGAPLVGTWTTSARTGAGTYEATMKVSETGGAYAITIEDKPMPGPDGSAGAAVPSTVSDVKVAGNDFTFKRTIEFQGQRAELTYTGTVTGNTLSATATSEFDTAQVTGTRQ